MEVYNFQDTEDYFNKLDKNIGLLKKENDINRYKINDNLGKGYFKYLNFRNGIELIMTEFELTEDVEFEYKCQFVNKGFELVYCIDGNVFCEDYNLKSDVKIKSNEIHFWKSNINDEGWMKYPKNTNIKIVNIYFDETFFEKLSYSGAKKLKRMICDHNLGQITKKLNMPAIIVPFEQIAECSWDYRVISEVLYLQSKAIEIISLFVNDEFFKKSNDNNVITKEEDIAKLKEVKFLISKNLVEPLSINELSQRVGLNTYKLKKGFKEIYNTTIFSYLRSLRMEKAREFLLKNNDNILHIANNVGYSNSSHFAAAFKNKYGINPSVFRENKRVQ